MPVKTRGPVSAGAVCPVHPGSLQALDDFAVMRFTEKCGQTRRHNRADIRHLLQSRGIGRQQGFQRAEMTRQITRRRLTHITNTERKNETGQRCLFAFLNSGNQILRDLSPIRSRPAKVSTVKP